MTTHKECIKYNLVPTLMEKYSVTLFLDHLFFNNTFELKFS